MISIFALVMPIQANNSIDTSVTPSHWAVITLEDELHAYYGEIWLKGWYTTEPYEPGLDGTINHVIWEVVYVDGVSSRIQVGDNIFSIHGWYEDGTHKWIHNAKDFNLHLETDFGASVSPSYGGYARQVEGKTYGTRVHGSIEWHWSWEGSPPVLVSAEGQFDSMWAGGGYGYPSTEGNPCSISIQARRLASGWTGGGVFTDSGYGLTADIVVDSATEYLWNNQVILHGDVDVGGTVYSFSSIIVPSWYLTFEIPGLNYFAHVYGVDIPVDMTIDILE